MKIVNAYGQRSDAATYNIRFVSDDHKTRSPIKLLVPMLLFGTVVAGATLTTWPPTLPSILTGGTFLIVGLVVGLTTGALMFRRRSPTSSIDHAASLTPHFLCCSIKDDEVMRLANTNLPTATKRTGEFNLKRDPLIQRQAFPLSFGKTLRLTVQPSDASATARRPCAR